jgi:transcriptional regulator with XRE-family HTH domain
VDVCQVIKQRLEELRLEQRDLAAAAAVTESYISQLLTRKKMPPAAERTDIYEKMAKFLNFPAGKLSELAELQRKEELKRTLVDPPPPLLKDVREMILRKCASHNRKQVQAIFEKQTFGELERLVTQKLLDMVKGVAKEELENENWLHLVAQLVGRSYEQMRVTVLDFLDTDIFNVSVQHCDTFLDPLIESWDIDLASFAMEVVLNRRLVQGSAKKFEFVEREVEERTIEEPGFRRFLRDRFLSGDATEEEVKFLEKLRFNGKRPTALYYYRELQNLRDPLHFRLPMSPAPPRAMPGHSLPERSVASVDKYLKADGTEKRLKGASRKTAIESRTKNKTKRDRKRRIRS